MEDFFKNFQPQDDTREIDIKFWLKCKMSLFVCDCFMNTIRQQRPLTQFKKDVFPSFTTNVLSILLTILFSYRNVGGCGFGLTTHANDFRYVVFNVLYLFCHCDCLELHELRINSFFSSCAIIRQCAIDHAKPQNYF